LPFKNKLVKIEVTGATLRAALEHGVSRSAEDSQPGGFPQVSGIRFSFDASRPPGSRACRCKVNNLPLDDAKKYTLTTTTFIGLEGGDGYSMFKGATVVFHPERLSTDCGYSKEVARAREQLPQRLKDASNVST
jgi:5'-nucleotidase